MMTNAILVTGATGNIGSQVVKQLVEAGANVRAAVRSTNKAEALPKVEWVEFDLNKPETVMAAFENVEKVFQVTPFVPNMVDIGATLVEAAKNARVKHIVRLSALGADASPAIALGRWHREVEKMIEASGIPFTFLRPNGFMQNFVNSAADTIKTQSAFYQPMEDALVSFVDTRDVAAVAVAALTQGGHEGKIYDITGPEALSNSQVAEILSQVVGRKINYVNVSDDAASQGMKDAGMPSPIVEAVIELFGLYKSGYASSVSPVVEQVTGKKPISFEQFVRDYADAFS